MSLDSIRIIRKNIQYTGRNDKYNKLIFKQTISEWLSNPQSTALETDDACALHSHGF